MAEKLSSEAAKAAVDNLYNMVAKRWEEVVTQGEFMASLIKGELPKGAIKLFFRNWGSLYNRNQYHRGVHLPEASALFQKTQGFDGTVRGEDCR